MVISRKDIELIGEAVIKGYIRSNMGSISFPIDIDHFARTYLGLAVEYRKLSDDGRLLGLTIYKDIHLELPIQDSDRIISVQRDTILLDSSLRADANIRRRRFTLAHECAHQILAHLEQERTSHSFCKNFTAGRQYSCRELKAAEDCSEWQANALGAVLLMPGVQLIPKLASGNVPHRFTLFGSRFNRADYQRLKNLSDMFQVSMISMAIRLNGLGFVAHKPKSEYAEASNIFAGAEKYRDAYQA